MNKKFSLVCVFVLFSAFLANMAAAADVKQEPICIVYFYSSGCSHCANVAPFISDLQENYGSKIAVHKYDVSASIENYNLYNEYCVINSVPPEKKKVPFIAVGNDYLIGDTPIIGGLESKIEELLVTGERVCPLGGEMECHPGNTTYNESSTSPALPWLKKLSLPLVVAAGFADGIFNPCALGVMAFFVMTMLAVLGANKKRVVKVGSVYIATVYVTYFLAGLGLLTVLQHPSIASVKAILFKAFAVLLLAAALINLKDFFFYGRWVSLKIPEPRKQSIKSLAYKSSVPAAMVLGFFVSLWELPCTGEAYFGILALLSSVATKAQAINYLLVYNFMFVLPLIFILIVLVKEVKAERMQHAIEKHKKLMRLALAVMLGLMAALLWSIA